MARSFVGRVPSEIYASTDAAASTPVVTQAPPEDCCLAEDSLRASSCFERKVS
jgi:hypothetical protein